MMIFRFRVWVLIIAITIASVASACAFSQSSSGKIRIQLKWFHQFQFAGYYAALEKGFYADEGLDVSLIEGGPHIKVDKEVLTGNADYGVLASELIRMRAQGEPVVMLAVIMQHSLRAIIVREDSGILSPSDLAGYLIMMNRNEDAEFMAMFRAEGVPLHYLNIIPKNKNANRKLLTGQIDGMNGSIANQPYIFKKNNTPVRLIRPVNYGINFYGDSLFTSENEVTNHSRRVEAVIRASLKGWQYAMDHPVEIADLIIQHYNSGKDKEQLLFEAEKLREVIVPDFIDIGHMSRHRISHIEKAYKDLGIITPEMSTEGLLYTPQKVVRNRLLKMIMIIAFASMIIILAGGSVMLVFNRRLSKRVKERTAALKKSEEQLRSVTETSPDYIIYLDTELKIRYVNRAETGLTVDALLGRYLYELADSQSRENVKHTLTTVLKTGELSVYETEFNRPDIGRVFFESYVAPVYENDIISGLIVTSRDVTLRKNAETEQERLKMQMMQLRKMEALGTLAGGIAHDFNNILSAILGFSELARDDVPEESLLADNLDQVIKASLRARSLVRQILTYSRQKTSEMEPVDIRPVIDEAVELLRASLPKSIEIVKEFQDSGLPVMADTTHIHQIIINLCTNASHAITDSGGRIGIKLSDEVIEFADSRVFSPALAPGRYLRIEVSDNGKGIPESEKDKIFDPYYTTKTQDTGSGLGLSVVQGIVKGMQGHISVYSEEGKGTVLIIFLPVIESGGHRTENKSVNEPVYSVNNEMILFVDDEKPIATLGERLLTSLGYNCRAVSDSREALEVFKQLHDIIQLVITDMSMPEMNGIELARHIKEINPSVPIVLCTGFSEIINPENAHLSGFSEFLTKPVTKKKMSNAINRALRQDVTMSSNESKEGVI